MADIHPVCHTIFSGKNLLNGMLRISLVHPEHCKTECHWKKKQQQQNNKKRKIINLRAQQIKS